MWSNVEAARGKLLISALTVFGWISDGKDSRSSFTMVQSDVFVGTLFADPCCWGFCRPDGKSTTEVLVAPFTSVT